MQIIIHLPKVSIRTPFVLGNFRIMNLPFESFYEIDRDWANDRYYQVAKPVFAISEMLDYEPTDKNIQNLIMPIYYAILLGSRHEYPTPMLSVTYFQYENHHVIRRIGEADRSYILHNCQNYEISPLQISRIQEIYTLCTKEKFHWDSPIFLLVKTLGDIYSQNVSEKYAALPLIVALETYLVGSNSQDNIVSKMANEISNVLDIDASNSIRKIYSWRSDILHGRKIKIPNTTQIFLELKELCCELTIQNLWNSRKDIC